MPRSDGVNRNFLATNRFIGIGREQQGYPISHIPGVILCVIGRGVVSNPDRTWGAFGGVSMKRAAVAGGGITVSAPGEIPHPVGVREGWIAAAKAVNITGRAQDCSHRMNPAGH